MNRRSFITRAGATIAGLVVAPRVTLENAAAAPAPALDAARAISWDAPLVASGGLCAPVTPYYQLDTLLYDRPIRSALPKVTAS